MPIDTRLVLSNVIVMMSTQSVVADSLDTVRPGDTNPTPVDEIPLEGCTFVWETVDAGAPFIVACTREDGHDGRQHVAQGDDETGVIAVHPWCL